MTMIIIKDLDKVCVFQEIVKSQMIFENVRLPLLVYKYSHSDCNLDFLAIHFFILKYYPVKIHHTESTFQIT